MVFEKYMGFVLYITGFISFFFSKPIQIFNDKSKTKITNPNPFPKARLYI